MKEKEYPHCDQCQKPAIDLYRKDTPTGPKMVCTECKYGEPNKSYAHMLGKPAGAVPTRLPDMDGRYTGGAS